MLLNTRHAQRQAVDAELCYLLCVPLLWARCPPLLLLSGRLWRRCIDRLGDLEASELRGWLDKAARGGVSSAALALLGNVVEASVKVWCGLRRRMGWNSCVLRRETIRKC